MLIYTFKTDLSGLNKKRIRDSLLSYILDKNYGIDVSKDQIYKNEFGKPYLKNISNVYFSITHCEDFIACSIDQFEHGIDAEKIRKFNSYVADRILSIKEKLMLKELDNNEKVFFTIWTLKESLGKAKGTGLNYDYKNTTFRLMKGNIICTDNSFKYKTFLLNGAYILSIATKEKNDDVVFEEVVVENGELNSVRQSVQEI